MISFNCLVDEIETQICTSQVENMPRLPNSPIVIIIYGSPGSGKTYIASKIAEELNLRLKNKLNISSDVTPGTLTPNQISIKYTQKSIHGVKGGELTNINLFKMKSNLERKSTLANLLNPVVHVKMDGFHIPLKKLDDDLIRRRGSPETFDSDQVVRLIELLTNNNGDWDWMSIPDFDHSVKDPSNPGTWISSKSKVIIVEGLYLMLNKEPWLNIPKLISSKRAQNNKNIKVIKIYGGTVDDVALRVSRRHLEAGIVDTLDNGQKRYFENDYINAKLVESESVKALTDYTIDNSS